MRHDAIIILTMRIAGTALWLIYTVLLARHLSKAEFATTIYVLNLALVAVVIITLGRDVALLRIGSSAWSIGAQRAVAQLLGDARRTVLVTGSFLTFAFVALSLMGIDTPVTASVPLAVLTGSITTALALMGLNRDVLRSIGRVWQSQLDLNITRSLVPLAGFPLVLSLGEMTAQIALLLFLSALVLSLLIEEVMLGRRTWVDAPDAVCPNLAELRRNGLQIWPGDIANAFQLRAAGLIAGIMLSPEAAALFLAAERIAGLAQFPINASSQAAAPRIARASRERDETFQAALTTGSLLMSVGTMIGVACAAMAAYPALLALGDDYSDAFPVTIILIAAYASWAVLGLAQPSLHLAGHFSKYTTVSITCAIGTTVLVSLGVSYGGSIGAATGFAVGWWVTNATYTVVFYRVTGLRTGLSSSVITLLRKRR